ncbi:conserved hypothetical protein [Phenylobacterium zucineum HLK1]|uniref:DUF983 domain-containing protein n=1 Tax=Phenylobacterium zucineum (strain HLK1) TaxID=450851 RepID=B4RHA2_PHEZH|nr:DUF983 domain-containing protein [Phenylobacterium zucineum]ACG79050.1 conserved hypothetical protein [Phenylobacterium zucineum HLK1]
MASRPALPRTLRTGLRCRCPRCGEGRLFSGFLTVADRCEACGLDYGFADPADGPAFFVMSGVSIVVTAVWGVWAATVQPPIWLQFAVVVPALVGGCLAALRPVKAWMVAEQYVHKAEEARFESHGTHGKAPEGYKSGRR